MLAENTTPEVATGRRVSEEGAIEATEDEDAQ